MPAKLGLSAAVCACLLMVNAPAFAQLTPAQLTPAGPPTTVTPATPSDTTTTIPTVQEQQLTPAPLGPAVAGGQTPVRGTQIQITPPPPPPPQAAAWDPFLLPANTGFGRRVVYSKSQQTVWAIDDSDVVIKAHRVSGRQDPLHPSPGVYRVWSRSRFTFAINNPSITWGYMVRFATGGNGGNIGFHDIPYQYGNPVQSIAQLGQALSGGCVRQAADDAIWMWNWADIGTVVVVTP
ncbi:MAG TPA: L,D-transpeptidase [Ilumatobacteraceae bacterium]|nr:L,D-transpeptidase [Ilumatobacteraceae bacterium]